MTKEQDIQRVQSEYMRELLKTICTKTSRKPSLEIYGEVV